MRFQSRRLLEDPKYEIPLFLAESCGVRSLQDKDLLTLRRTNDRLATEREAADAAAEGDREYARRLEAKLSINTSALETADHNLRLKGRLKEEKAEAATANARAAAAETSASHLKQEVRSGGTPSGWQVFIISCRPEVGIAAWLEGRGAAFRRRDSVARNTVTLTHAGSFGPCRRRTAHSAQVSKLVEPAGLALTGKICQPVLLLQ